MAAMSLWDAADQVGTSKSAIWRAIKDGRLSARRDESGNFSVDPNEVIRVLSIQEPARSEEAANAQSFTPAKPFAAADYAPASENAASARAPEDGARIAALESEVAGLKLLLAEMRVHRDDLRGERDAWRNQAERLMATLRVDAPSRWKRMTGGGF